ncbi:hypothetical protein IWX90DRAFT_499672, partial [Phyllosticta citrichinensis]
ACLQDCRLQRLANTAKASIEETTRIDHGEATPSRAAPSRPNHSTSGEARQAHRNGKEEGPARRLVQGICWCTGRWLGGSRPIPCLGSASASPQATSSPTAAPQLPSSQACSLTSPGPGHWTSPNWACSNNLRAAPSPQSLLLPPRRRSLHLHLSLDLSPPSASHSQPRPPPHSCIYHPSCPPPPARGSKTPRRTRSSLPFLQTMREKKKRSTKTPRVPLKTRKGRKKRKKLSLRTRGADWTKTQRRPRPKKMA